MLNGWIKTHRKILDHWVADEPELFAMWMRLLIEANHYNTKKMFNGSLVEIKRGQLIFGLNAFSSKSNISVAKLRRYLNLLEADAMIDKQNASKYSIITITCFEEYQSIDKQNASRQQADNKQTTSRQQHRKNVKNVKNVKKTYKWQNHQLPEWIPKDAWIEWMNQRVDRQKAINSERAINGLIKKLTECVDAGYDAAECIDLAIQKPWKSIDVDWLENTKLKGRSDAKSKAESEFDGKDYTKGATDGIFA